MRNQSTWLLALLLAATTLPAGATDPATDGATLENRVREAALATWVHGMTDEIALREVGLEGVPVLIRLLREPGFPRRDNVVAMLAHLADDGATPSLLRHLEAPATPLGAPAEDRALLLVPHALGHISRRGGQAATQALSTLASSPGHRGPVDQAVDRGAYSAEIAEELAQQARHGLASASGAVAFGTAGDSDAGATEVRAVDPSTSGHASGLTYANHAAIPSPMSDATLDHILDFASDAAGGADFAEDIACCVRVERSGSGKTFGFSGDGLDVIDSEGDLLAVAQNAVARVKVVRLINWCGGAGTNIVGCAFLPGTGMVVVRLGSNEGLLWLHEYGHNAGLSHNADERYIMHGRLRSTARALTFDECGTYHAPSPGSGMTTTFAGVCHDDDGDDLASTSDNCPDVNNPSQADQDSDGVGDVCDGCVDQDEDGFGSPPDPACPQGLVADCDDGNAEVYPGAREFCDGTDNDCDESIDEALCGEFEATGDGMVDGIEVAWLGWAFGLCSAPESEWWSMMDYTGEGCVDGEDLAILSYVYGCADAEPVCD